MPQTIRLADITLPSDVEPEEAGPPPRFAGTDFEGFRPANESQREACRLVREFAADLADGRPRRVWPWRSHPRGRGLYLDGGYGVGKTHLLAAAYHTAPAREKAYFTFQEFVHTIGAQGLATARERFARLRLLCLDEFELDDPGNTLIVKRALEGVLASGGSVITTSNTPPEAQGRGRFNAGDFRREIQGIADNFTVITMEGSDFRRRERVGRLLTAEELTCALAHPDIRPPAVLTDHAGLEQMLGRLHPIRYREVLSRIGTLFISDMTPIARQDDALRFVHFIDQLYDRRVGLRASGAVALEELFDSSYRHSGYARKHERCISRLAELLEEPLSARPAARPAARLAAGFDRASRS